MTADIPNFINIRIITKEVVVSYFYDGHVLQVWSETVAVLKRMIYDGHMITGDECGTNFLTSVLRLRENPGKNLNQEIDPNGDRTRVCCVRSNEVTPRQTVRYTLLRLFWHKYF